MGFLLLLPPDSVPMMDEPATTSEFLPTATPGATRPSTIDSPSVPALKSTKPSCMTIAPFARWAPSLTRSASAARTPAGTTWSVKDINTGSDDALTKAARQQGLVK